MKSPSGRLHILFLVAFFGAASVACAGPAAVLSPPTAAEILKKPATAGYTDAHFILKIRTSPGAFVLDLSGEGTVVRNPPASQMHYKGSFGSIPLAFDLISIGGRQYSRSGTEKWAVKDVVSGLTPDDWSKGSNPKLLGEDSIGGAKAWHVSATESVGVPFELWVRESDGYPLKFTSSGPANPPSPSPGATGASATVGGTVELDFDKFNTGVKIQAPSV